MSDNQQEAALPRLTSLEKVLQEVNHLGHFMAAVLASNEGLPVATVSSSYDTDVTAAMVAPVSYTHLTLPTNREV